MLPKGATSEGPLGLQTQKACCQTSLGWVPCCWILRYLAFSRELAASGLVLSEGAWSDDELL